MREGSGAGIIRRSCGQRELQSHQLKDPGRIGDGVVPAAVWVLAVPLAVPGSGSSVFFVKTFTVREGLAPPIAMISKEKIPALPQEATHGV